MIRAELIFMPLLICVPLLVGFFLINDWYVRGFSVNNSDYTAQLFLGIIILAGNILFDIPFIKSLIKLSKDKK